MNTDKELLIAITFLLATIAAPAVAAGIYLHPLIIAMMCTAIWTAYVMTGLYLLRWDGSKHHTAAEMCRALFKALAWPFFYMELADALSS